MTTSRETLIAALTGLVILSCSDDASSTPADMTDTTDGDAAGDTAGDQDAEIAPGDLVDDASPRLDTCVGPPEAAIGNASLPAGYCAWTWASDLRRPRGITGVGEDVLVVERERSQVTVLWDDDHDGVSGPGERAALATANGLNHGVVVQADHLYASSDTTVYRWPYVAGTRADLGSAETVIQGIPGGGHSTRTLAFDNQGRLYVTIGSAGNIDSDSTRARMRRFTLPEPFAPTDFASGEVFADGMRNIVGLGWDDQGRLWGVENGVDNLSREDLGGDIHNDNPAEEVNRFADEGRFYGYPQCWSEFALPENVGGGPGTQWVTPGFSGSYSDEWCRDTDNVVPPAFAMQAHSAPLDITFYDGGSFPSDVVGDALISFHGSWNRDERTGYKVVRLRFEGDRPVEILPLFEYGGPGDFDTDWPHRPVGIHVGARGEVYVTSDSDGRIIAIGHEGS